MLLSAAAAGIPQSSRGRRGRGRGLCTALGLQPGSQGGGPEGRGRGHKQRGGVKADPGRSRTGSGSPRATLEGQPCSLQACDPRPQSLGPAAKGTRLRAAAEDKPSPPSSPPPLEREPRLEGWGTGLARRMKL